MYVITHLVQSLQPRSPPFPLATRTTNAHLFQRLHPRSRRLPGLTTRRMILLYPTRPAREGRTGRTLVTHSRRGRGTILGQVDDISRHGRSGGRLRFRSLVRVLLLSTFRHLADKRMLLRRRRSLRFITRLRRRWGREILIGRDKVHGSVALLHSEAFGACGLPRPTFFVCLVNLVKWVGNDGLGGARPARSTTTGSLA